MTPRRTHRRENERDGESERRIATALTYLGSCIGSRGSGRERERDDVDVRGISISIAHRIPRVGIKSEKSRAASSTQGYIDRSLPPSFLFPVFCFFLLFLLYFLFFFNFYTSQALISSHTRLSLSRRGMAQARGTLLYLFGIHFIFDDVNIGST